MSGWLSRAKEALSGRAVETAPEPVELPCPCGRKIEAIRRDNFQRVLCKSCGEAFFVLPIDVYPRPVLKKARQAKPGKTSASAKSVTSKGTNANSADAAEAVASAPLFDIARHVRNFAHTVLTQFTALRLIVMSLMLVLGLTGWWQFSRASRSRAEIDFKTAVDAGQAALLKKDFVSALQEFARAGKAADVLQRQDSIAEQARQRQRELSAVTSLMQRSLSEILDAAQAARQKGNPAAAESEFASIHAGRWLVLHSEIPPPSSPDTLSIWEQRVQVQENILLLTATLPAFAQVSFAPSSTPQPLANANSEPNANADANANAEPNAMPSVSPLQPNDLGYREVIFAAQVESLRWDAAQSLWVLTLVPQSGFLWSDYELLHECGLAPDELRSEAQLRQLLSEQSRWIGVTE